MRVLLDECLPKRLAKDITRHDVRTVSEMWWSGKKNGELLRLMVSHNFQIFVTTDQNLRYEQNLSLLDVAVVVLAAPSNRLRDLIPLLPSLILTLETIQNGELKEIMI